MANIQSNAAQPAGRGSGPGYSVPNKAAPLPRQWQLPPPQVPVPRSQVALQHFHPEPAGARTDHRQPATSSRWMERAVLLGLWLLVMLTAIAIVQRMLDLSVMTATPAEAQAPAHVSADVANVMRSAAMTAALTAARDEDSDPLDDVTPAPAPQPLVVSPPPAPARRLTPATTLAIRHPAAPVPVAIAERANREPVCVEALSAMQLCPD